MSTPYGITLTLAAQTIYSQGNNTGFRFTVTASGGNNMDNNIFRYTMAPYNYITQAQAAYFTGICSAEELSSIPIGAPDPTDPNQYFRTNVVDLVFPTRAEADDTWTQIQADVTTLVNSLVSMSKLSVTQTVRIGT